MKKAAIVPSTAKSLIDRLVEEHKLTITRIARTAGLNPCTIYRLRKGQLAAPSTQMCLIRLYLQQFYNNKR